jgi:shikimate dehydrogenase
MSYKVAIDPQTLFLLSTSGSASSIEKHNKALQAMDVNLVYFTFSHEISAEEYANLLRSSISKGGAVTGQGLKSAIIPFLDEVDELAKVTNCVNTVINKNGILHGYNTDSFGFENALRTHIEKSKLSIQTAVIYGNGGVSGSAAHVLQSMGIRTTMKGRDDAKVAAKMQELQLESFNGPYDLVVNATPVSSRDIKEAIGLTDILLDTKVVFDHNMPEKDGNPNYLRQYCDQHTIYFIPGSDMYLAQMIQQWQLFLNGSIDNNGKMLSLSDADIKKYWSL